MMCSESSAASISGSVGTTTADKASLASRVGHPRASTRPPLTLAPRCGRLSRHFRQSFGKVTTVRPRTTSVPSIPHLRQRCSCTAGPRSGHLLCHPAIGRVAATRRRRSTDLGWSPCRRTRGQQRRQGRDGWGLGRATAMRPATWPARRSRPSGLADSCLVELSRGSPRNDKGDATLHGKALVVPESHGLGDEVEDRDL